MFSMSLSRPREAAMSEPFPCAECGKVQMRRVVENCRLEDGCVVKRLSHLKCGSCGARFFDDEAMHRIQSQRATQALATSSR